MLTLTEAAQRLGITPDTLRQQVHAGRLRARKFGPIWVVEEEDLARYRLDSWGRVGAPFQGRPGYVDTQHVRACILFTPADGRGHDAVWLQYNAESYVLNLDLTDPKPFKWTGQEFQDANPDPTPPGQRSFRFWNRQHLARELGTTATLVEIVVNADPTSPRPIITFRDGPIWDADQVDRWLRTRGP